MKVAIAKLELSTVLPSMLLSLLNKQVKVMISGRKFTDYIVHIKNYKGKGQSNECQLLSMQTKGFVFCLQTHVTKARCHCYASVIPGQGRRDTWNSGVGQPSQGMTNPP